MLAPTQTFTANSPPPWLQQDMQLAARYLPEGVKVLVLFRDEIETTRVGSNFNTLAKEAWPHIRDDQLMRLESTFLSPYGLLRHDAVKRDSEQRSCPVTGLSEATSHIFIKPKHAVIVLPSRKMNARDFTLSTTSLTQVCDTLAIPHRAVYWHEFGHLRMACKENFTIRDRLDERNADLSVHHGCGLNRDATTLIHFTDWRSITNFNSEITASASKYWNQLSLHKIAATETDELASLLELKVRAAGQRVHTQKADSFVRKVMTDPRYKETREIFATKSISVERNLERLAEMHKTRPYVFKHSCDMGSRMLSSACRLSSHLKHLAHD